MLTAMPMPNSMHKHACTNMHAHAPVADGLVEAPVRDGEAAQPFHRQEERHPPDQLGPVEERPHRIEALAVGSGGGLLAAGRIRRLGGRSGETVGRGALGLDPALWSVCGNGSV